MSYVTSLISDPVVDGKRLQDYSHLTLFLSCKMSRNKFPIGIGKDPFKVGNLIFYAFLVFLN
jgi:hypothetical protein